MSCPSHTHTQPTMLKVLVLCIFLNIASNNMLVHTYTFKYTTFDHQSCGDQSDLMCMGSVNSENGTLNITPYSNPNLAANKVGRVLHRQPVLAWPASFCTTFTVRIVKDVNSSGFGDGMAFIMAQDNRPSPPESYGSYLGILDQSTQGGVLHQLAVELDTYRNEYDPDSNHIAIDTISVSDPPAIKSLYSTDIELKSGKEITFKIEYNGWTKNLQIFVAYANDPLVSFLNHSIRMEKTVPSKVYVGFTGSIGTLFETHQVLDWNFTSSELPNESLKQGKENTSRIVLIVVVPVTVGLLLFGVFGTPYIIKARRKKRERRERREDIESLTRNAVNAPRMFTYKQLSKATQNFRRENLLGTGGFGSVYKGFLKNPPTTIAVKKISATSSQGEKEYLAEICTIGRLRHKNLLLLKGWCHEHRQLLLVYDYMSNGSLDRFIGKGNFLDWKTRYKVLTGLASALVYLHEECGNPIVHRDVKPNNVMLDAEFNAHLGDFGLARLLQNEASVTTIIAGTPGYLAPEVSFTGRVNPESDIYSFGMVVLEVVCGRRSKGIMEEDSLVDGVWNLYEMGKLVNCVDKSLESNYDVEQVKRTLIVGLACLHPDYKLRPKMRKVVQVFINPGEAPMSLPKSRPSAVSLSFHSRSASTDSGGDTGDSTELLPDEVTIHDMTCEL